MDARTFWLIVSFVMLVIAAIYYLIKDRKPTVKWKYNIVGDDCLDRSKHHVHGANCPRVRR